MQAILLLGHGSKAPEALNTLEKIKEMMVAKLPSEIVEIASMEFNKPDIPEAVKKVVEQGVDKIIVLPVFLYFGIHLQEDIPQILAEEKLKYPHVEIVMADNIGADPRLVSILEDRVKEVS